MQILYYLSGLTCTDENVIQKSGIQRKAAQLGVSIVAPDTSPRGLGTPGTLLTQLQSGLPKKETAVARGLEQHRRLQGQKTLGTLERERAST